MRYSFLTLLFVLRSIGLPIENGVELVLAESQIRIEGPT